jgi:hypothetical protein
MLLMHSTFLESNLNHLKFWTYYRSSLRSDFVNGSEDTRSWQKWLLSVLQNRLAEYPTSLEEDQKLTADDNDDRRVVMAIMVRIGEKDILTETINKLLELEPSGEPPAKRLKT